MWVKSCGVSITGCMHGMCSTNVGKSESVQFVVPTSLQFGHTAMDKARENGHMEIVQLIKQYTHAH